MTGGGGGGTTGNISSFTRLHLFLIIFGVERGENLAASAAVFDGGGTDARPPPPKRLWQILNNLLLSHDEEDYADLKWPLRPRWERFWIIRQEIKAFCHFTWSVRRGGNSGLNKLSVLHADGGH